MSESAAKLQSATALLAAMPDTERLTLARTLLDGFVEEDQQGRRRTGYLAKGSCEELAARLVMADCCAAILLWIVNSAPIWRTYSTRGHRRNEKLKLYLDAKVDAAIT
jgi:hypothetical protein